MSTAKEPFQVQWRINKHWRPSQSFRTHAEAVSYAELRKLPPYGEYRIFNWNDSRKLTEPEVRLLLNIALAETCFWRTKITRYLKTGKRKLLDRTDADYAMLDKIGEDCVHTLLGKLQVKDLRVLLEEHLQETRNDALRDRAREMYGSDEVQVDGNAIVSSGDGGHFVAAWLWVPES